MLLLAAALPLLYWDAGPAAAPALRAAHIDRIAVPAAQQAAWRSVQGILVATAAAAGRVRLVTPNVEYRPDEASASRAPWLNSNGWRILRQPDAHFTYEAPGKTAALAAAEAFSYGIDALVHTDEAGATAFGEMLEFLRAIEPADLPPLADVGIVDDGATATGEVVNMLLRNNVLVEFVAKPDPRVKLTVRIGSKDFPAETAKNPSVMEHAIRFKLTDDKRSLRIYGTQVALARVTGGGDRLRLALLNYDGARRAVDGLRVRVLGRYPNHRAAAAGGPVELQDFTADDQATEFTLPDLRTFAVIDLSR